MTEAPPSTTTDQFRSQYYSFRGFPELEGMSRDPESFSSSLNMTRRGMRGHIR